MPNSDASDESPIIPSQPNSLPVQFPNVPSPNITAPNSPVQVPNIIAPNSPAQVPTVPSPNITAPNSLVQVPSPNIIAPNPQASTLVIPQQTFLNPIFTPNPNQASFLIPHTVPNSGVNTNLEFDGNYANPQQSCQSLTDLMAEAQLYDWPIQFQSNQQGLGNQDLFDFSGFQDLSGMNNFNSDTSVFSPDMNVRLVLQASGSTDY